MTFTGIIDRRFLKLFLLFLLSKALLLSVGQDRRQNNQTSHISDGLKMLLSLLKFIFLNDGCVKRVLLLTYWYVECIEFTLQLSIKF